LCVFEQQQPFVCGRRGGFVVGFGFVCVVDGIVFFPLLLLLLSLDGSHVLALHSCTSVPPLSAHSKHCSFLHTPFE
jgi:hypothetical protein